MKKPINLTAITLLLAASSLSAATHYVSLGSTNPMPPYTDWVTAATNIQDAVHVALTKDVVMVTNGVYPGGLDVYLPLSLLSVNGPRFTVIDGGRTFRCVTLADGTSLTGFTLTNGWGFQTGGGAWCASTNAVLTNCTLTGNSCLGPPGPPVYGGLGGGAYRGTLYNCTLSGNSALYGGGAIDSTLYNCTLTGNRVMLDYNWGGYGGGVDACTLYNCTLGGNSAAGGGGGASGSALYNCILTNNSASGGGGAYDSTLYNCSLAGNYAHGSGGGTYGGVLHNCTMTGNSAQGPGGGAAASQATPCALDNCIVYFNTATNSANYDSNCSLTNCCTTPLPGSRIGNITNAPLFVDSANGNLRLQSSSPCINAGNNRYVTTTTDLDGRPRIVGGTVDIGAYEFQPGVSGAFIAWLLQYGLPTDGSSDYADPDYDGMNNWQEWVCGTNPTNRLSLLRLLSPSITGTKTTVTWQSVAGMNYLLERSANPAAPFTLLATNILGQAGTTSYGDTNAAGKGPFFYRVGIRSP